MGKKDEDPVVLTKEVIAADRREQERQKEEALARIARLQHLLAVLTRGEREKGWTPHK